MMKTNKVPDELSEYSMDAFKILSLTVKITNLNRLDKINTELLPKCNSLYQEGPSASNPLRKHVHAIYSEFSQQ